MILEVVLKYKQKNRIQREFEQGNLRGLLR